MDLGLGKLFQEASTCRLHLLISHNLNNEEISENRQFTFLRINSMLFLQEQHSTVQIPQQVLL